MSSFEFYKELYHLENQRRETINNSLSIPLAILTGLVAGVYVLFTTFPFDQNLITTICFSILLICGIFSMGYSSFYLCKVIVKKLNWRSARSSFEYKAIADPTSLLRWNESLESTFAGDPDEERLILSEFQRQLREQFVECAHHNQKVNDDKVEEALISKLTAVYSLIFFFLSIIPYVIAYLHKNDEIYRVQIENSKNEKEHVVIKNYNYANDELFDTAKSKPKSESRKPKSASPKTCPCDTTGKAN